MSSRIQFIKSPSKGVVNLLKHRINSEAWERIQKTNWDSVALIQANLPLLFAFADNAEKSADVIVEEIRGTCPQHLSMIAIFGSTSAVQAALEGIDMFLNNQK